MMNSTISILLIQMLTTIKTGSNIELAENTKLTITSDAISAIINNFYCSSIVNIKRAATKRSNNLELSDFIDATLERLNKVKVTVEDLTVRERQRTDRSVYNLLFIDEYRAFRYKLYF